MLTVTEDDLKEITGDARPMRVLAEFHRQGFHFAPRSPTTGGVLLERPHHEAMTAPQPDVARLA